MSHDEFTKLFIYLQEELGSFRAEVQMEFVRVHARFDAIEGLVDAHEKRIETQEQERLFANHQLDRHEEWITQAAPKVGVKYKR